MPIVFHLLAYFTKPSLGALLGGLFRDIQRDSDFLEGHGMDGAKLEDTTLVVRKGSEQGHAIRRGFFSDVAFNPVRQLLNSGLFTLSLAEHIDADISEDRIKPV